MVMSQSLFGDVSNLGNILIVSLKRGKINVIVRIDCVHRIDISEQIGVHRHTQLLLPQLHLEQLVFSHILFLRLLETVLDTEAIGEAELITYLIQQNKREQFDRTFRMHHIVGDRGLFFRIADLIELGRLNEHRVVEVDCS